MLPEKGINFNCKHSREVLVDELQNDLVPDFGSEPLLKEWLEMKKPEPSNQDVTDEPILVSHLEYGRFYFCKQPNMLPCREGHSRCFWPHDICIFKVHIFGVLQICRNGAHIENCKQFECNAHFKCPNSYCIPFYFFCDGKIDCPDTTDENEYLCNQRNRVCKKMFKCIETNITCVHPRDICDGDYDCPQGDDELFCAFHGFYCPRNCQCLLMAITCSKRHLAQKVFPPFQKVLMKEISGMQWKALTGMFPEVIILQLHNIGLGDICKEQLPAKVKYLDVQNNILSVLESMCFCCASLLKNLILERNQITEIEMKAFVNLTSLYVLSLSNNPLYILSDEMIDHSVRNSLVIKLMYINNPHIDEKTFTGIVPKIVMTRNYKVCCLLPSQIKCTANIPWHFFCHELLPNKAMKIMFFCCVFLFLQQILFHLQFTNQYPTWPNLSQY